MGRGQDARRPARRRLHDSWTACRTEAPWVFFFFREVYLCYVPGCATRSAASRRRGEGPPGAPEPPYPQGVAAGARPAGLSQRQGMLRRGGAWCGAPVGGQGGLEARLCVRVDRRPRDGRGGHSSIHGRDAGRWQWRGVAGPGARLVAWRSRGTGLGAGPGGQWEGGGTATQELGGAPPCAFARRPRWALRGGAPARAGGGPRARTRASAAPVPSRGKVLPRSTPRWWGHPGRRGGRGPWAGPDTGCARASTEPGPRARAALRLPYAFGVAVPTLEEERERSGSRGERRARRTGGGPKRQGACPGCRGQLAIDASSRGRAC